jgi:hypothetical protein
MTIHLYFSLIPEALIASMLGPEEFGQYYSTGHQYKSKGQAIFFEVDPTFRTSFLTSTRASSAVYRIRMARRRIRFIFRSTEYSEHIPGQRAGQAVSEHRLWPYPGLEPRPIAPRERAGPAHVSRI